MLFMKRENPIRRERLIKLLFHLIKNSKRSDRDLAKILGVSQPTVTRLRKVLEREAVQQYTLIPNFSYLGCDIVAFTFFRSKELVHPLIERGEKWAKEQPNVVFASTGQGIEADALVVSIHKDYSDFVKFFQNFRTEWGEYLIDFKTFFLSLKGSFVMKHFSFNSLAKIFQKEA
jgi:DNA-binding Lrp family transcriptional regulator